MVVTWAQAPSAARARAHAPVYGYEITGTYPHDRGAFTQGLEYRAGFLYEGTGLYGRSSIRKVKLETGEVLQNLLLPSAYFGEGITVLNQQILQLTWQQQTGFVYDQHNFSLKRRFSYPGEGWGLANDGRRVFMSDGTAHIRIWDAVTLQEANRLTVRDGNEPVPNLNELEFVRGELYANVWQSERVARISPADGRVLGWVDLSGLLPAADRTANIDVLNGIAYDAAADRLFVTGKLWPKLFQIRVVRKQ